MVIWRLRSLYKKSGNKYLRKILKIISYSILKRKGSFIGINAKIFEGTKFPHDVLGIFISNEAEIKKGCTIMHHVTIGSSYKNKVGGAPIIGENCYIGAGAKIIGNILVGSNVKIGAGAVVTENIEDNVTVVSVKSRIIRRIDD